MAGERWPKPDSLKSGLDFPERLVFEYFDRGSEEGRLILRSYHNRKPSSGKPTNESEGLRVNLQREKPGGSLRRMEKCDGIHSSILAMYRFERVDTQFESQLPA